MGPFSEYIQVYGNAGDQFPKACTRSFADAVGVSLAVRVCLVRVGRRRNLLLHFKRLGDFRSSS